MRSTTGLPAVAGAAVVALAVTALGGCSAGGSPSGSPSDGKPVPVAGSAVSPAPPGKYRTLPQPCAAVDPESLKRLVPGSADYAGTESLTYDTDRRVGCGWRGLASDGTARALRIDFVRVVSYDPAVSDEVQAETDFDQQAAAASISLTPVTGTAPASPTTPVAPTATHSGAGGLSASKGPSGTTDLAPRRLTDVGNAAFINDVLRPLPAGPRRDVTVVFRTANVLVTVLYSQSAPRGGTQPLSAGLQQGARDVAAQLERTIER
ncbi:hypothetical protein [Streptomyces sp.]|uniref:hypothetical protein n=1 Tax=Streptomyces sp. TaxID=1931 RepID=UPI002F3EF4FC